MKTVLLTAFEPYDAWTTNASWLALVELVRDLPQEIRLVTRRYPVDFATVRQRLTADLEANYDYAIHLGQAPGSARLRLEAIGINVGARNGEASHPLIDNGPVAYRSPLPLDDWAAKLVAAGIPAAVSYHAGTYLCNATLYWSCHLAERMSLPTQSVFVHLPLDVSQTAGTPADQPSLPAAMSAAGVRMILDELAAGGLEA